jgi:uncharacterized protein (DUF697 family)
MSALDARTRAQFRILVAVAQADGKLEEREVTSLREVLGRHGAELDSWLAERIDVDAELAHLDREGRRQVYHSAFAMAHADGNASMDEVNLLRRILSDEAEASIPRQVLGEAADTLLPARILPEPDAAQRDLEINEDILKYSALSAVAGAMPLPGLGIVADIAVIALQAKMVHDIGQYCGHALDQKAIRGFMASVMGSTGLRIAINNLARVVPGWGSVFAAGTSFASTFALGKVAQRYFEAGKTLDESELRDLFSQQRSAGSSVFESRKEHVDAVRAASGATIEALNAELAAGRITKAEYEARLAEL